MTKFKNRRAAYHFAVEAASDAGIVAQKECVAMESDRHEPHGRFAAHKQAKDRVFPVAFYAHLSHLESFDGTRDEIIQQANKFVETGYRNSTWVSVDLGDALYIARNVHGKSVGQTNHD